MNSLFLFVKNLFTSGGKLSPWGTYSSRNITSSTSHYFVRGFTSKLIGKIYSTDATAILSFRREESGMKGDGTIEITSTDFQIYVKVKNEDFSVYYNKRHIGVLKKSGELYSRENEEIGFAEHPVKASMSIGSVKARFGASHFPVMMNNRKLATVWVSPDDSYDTMASNLIFNENTPGHTILQVHDKPTDKEEEWLIAIAALEVVYHGHWIIGR